jgi:hypothetical protein
MNGLSHQDDLLAANCFALLPPFGLLPPRLMQRKLLGGASSMLK